MMLSASRVASFMLLGMLSLNVGCQTNGSSTGRRNGATQQGNAGDNNDPNNRRNIGDGDQDITVDLPNGFDPNRNSTAGGSFDPGYGGTTTTPNIPMQPQVSERCYKVDASICDIEYKIFELTNEFRQTQGLQPLRFSKNASFVARDWSMQQGQSGWISHAGFPWSRQAQYQTEFKTQYNATGENVAMMSGSSDPAQRFVTMWINSWGHRRNMLGDHETLGVGVIQTQDGAWYATQLFGAE